MEFTGSRLEKKKQLKNEKILTKLNLHICGLFEPWILLFYLIRMNLNEKLSLKSEVTIRLGIKRFILIVDFVFRKKSKIVTRNERTNIHTHARINPKTLEMAINLLCSYLQLTGKSTQIPLWKWNRMYKMKRKKK